MRGFFSISKKQAPVLITLLVVISLLSVYFFIYLPSNEKDLQAQRFRVLQNIDSNIVAKVDNSTTLLKNLLSAYIENDIPAYRINLNKYISQFQEKDFKLSGITASTANFAPGVYNKTSIVLNNQNYDFSLFLSSKDTTAGGGNKAFRIGMASSLQKFIVPLLPDDVFDEYLVFWDGKLILQTFRSGIHYVKEDSLLNVRNGISGWGIRTVTISGKEYKLFVQPVKFGDSGELIIAALINNQRYQQEKYQLPLNAVLLLITVVLLMMVSLPWIKLYQMGSKDRLTITDGIATGAVSMLLTSLLFFALFKYNSSFRPDISSGSEAELAHKIKSALLYETRLAYKTLFQFDSLIMERDELKTNVRLLGQSGIQSGNLYENEKNTVSDSVSNFLNNLCLNQNIHQAFWLDSSGMESYNWTSRSANAPYSNFRSRNYFKKVKNNDIWHINNDNKKSFYLDQIVSWNTGGFVSVISKPSLFPSSGPAEVVAMSFDMNSLRNTILPPGYQFAIIDRQATVLYHTNQSKSLNENLLDEFSEKAMLKSCLEAGNGSVFDTKYYGNDYTVKIEPVTDMPYYVVIFCNNAFKMARDIEVFSFTISMMFFFFSFLVLQLLLIFLASSRRSFFRKQLLSTSWVGPKISSCQQYNLSVAFNLIIIVLLILFFNNTRFLQFLFILLLASFFISFFLNAIFAIKYKRSGQEEYRFKKAAIIVLGLLIVSLNLIAARILGFRSYIPVVGFELLSIGLGFLVFNISSGSFLKKILPDKETAAGVPPFVRSYTWMVLTRLIITSGIPVVFFFLSGYNYEQNLNTRYRHSFYAEQLLNKLKEKRIDIKEYGAYLKKTASGIFNDKAWINRTEIVPRRPLLPPDSEEDTITLAIFNLFRFYQSREAIMSAGFYRAGSADSSLLYNNLPDIINASNGNTVTYKAIPGYPACLKISSGNLNYNIPSLFSDNGFIFWLLLFAVISVLYFVLNDILKKIFAQNIPSTIGWEIIDRALLTERTLSKLIFVIGLPGSGKLKYILKQIENKSLRWGHEELFYHKDSPEKGNVLLADLIVIPDKASTGAEHELWQNLQDEVRKENYKMIIVNHFEYNLKDPETNNIKLNFLEQLMMEGKKEIIVLSTVHPVTFLDSLNVSESVPENNAGFKHELERWHVLLGHFMIIIHPLQSSPKGYKGYSWEKLIQEETAYTHFLSKMRNPVLTAVRDDFKAGNLVDCNSLAFKLHATAHYFYMYMWQSLTREEKFLLYDLAEDGLVNTYDHYNLSMLISKGVIIHSDGTLKLFNKGFRNFILTAIGNSEAMQIRSEIKDNGNWSTLKAPLQVIIAAILLFLFASQQEAYSRLITYAAALGGSIPMILKLFTLFDKGNGQKGT